VSAEYQSNHYVPQWYQRQFIDPERSDQELYLLDLKPGSFKDGKGRRHRHRALRVTGTKHCFAIDDLYATRLRGSTSRELERVFFGDIDDRGRKAVKFFAGYEHDRMRQNVLDDLMLFMSTQKLRTPKGLDWLVDASGATKREDVLRHVVRMQSLYGAIWTECVWQIADASASPTKFIVSDHPVTVYNKACTSNNPLYCKGPRDPDIRMNATHTLFPLCADRLLILTNLAWACAPYRSPMEFRVNPELQRGAMFNFLEVQVRRQLDEHEVREVNFVLKRRAYQFIAAGREEWLYPERHVQQHWRDLGGGHLLMPDPRSLTPGAEYMMGYSDGSTHGMDTFGRLPEHAEFGQESRSGSEHELHRRWRSEFEQRHGPSRRGMCFDDMPTRPTTPST